MIKLKFERIIANLVAHLTQFKVWQINQLFQIWLPKKFIVLMIDSVLKSSYVAWRALTWVFSLIRYLNWNGLWLGVDVRTLKDKYSKEIALQAQKLLSLLGSIFYIIGRTKMSMKIFTFNNEWAATITRKAMATAMNWIYQSSHTNCILYPTRSGCRSKSVSPKAHLPWHTNSNMNSPNTARFLIWDHQSPKIGGGVLNLEVSWPV
jgi:hypothetical protein